VATEVADEAALELASKAEFEVEFALAVVMVSNAVFSSVAVKVEFCAPGIAAAGDVVCDSRAV
jgi:hypothetical protein